MGEILNLREKDATEVPRRHSETKICGDAEAAVSVEAGGGGQGDGAVLYCTVYCTTVLQMTPGYRPLYFTPANQSPCPASSGYGGTGGGDTGADASDGCDYGDSGDGGDAGGGG